MIMRLRVRVRVTGAWCAVVGTVLQYARVVKGGLLITDKSRNGRFVTCLSLHFPVFIPDMSRVFSAMPFGQAHQLLIFLPLATFLPLTSAQTTTLSFSSKKVDVGLRSTGFKANAAVRALSNPAGEAFLLQNGQSPGVGVLPNGLQLQICDLGYGTAVAMPDSQVTLHYEGRLAENWPNGPTFESSFERGEPAVFTPTNIIIGLAIPLVNFMVEGAVWQIFVPSDLAYGDQGTPDGAIPPGSVVCFTVQVLAVGSPSQEPLGVGGAPVGGCPPLPEVAAGGSGGGGSGGGSTTAIVLVLLVVAAAGGYYYYKKNQGEQAGAGGDVTMTSVPPPPAPGQEGYTAPPSLPDGWQEMKDPNSGQAYFYNSQTGESTWVRPNRV